MKRGKPTFQNYFFLCLEEPSYLEYIDYNLSECFINDSNKFGKNYQEQIFKLTDEKDLLNRQVGLGVGKSIRFKRLYLMAEFYDKHPDMFYFSGLEWYVLISEKLKNIFEKEKITGLEMLREVELFSI